MIVSVAASSIATLTGGLGEVTLPRVSLVFIFVLCNGTEVLCVERARRDHASSVLVAAGMAVGALVAYTGVLLLSPAGGTSTSGYIAATVVGVMGTTGRWLRASALPFIGSAVASSTSQIAALVTALGGILLLGDSVRAIGVVLSVIAATSAAVAVYRAGREGAATDLARPAAG